MQVPAAIVPSWSRRLPSRSRRRRHRLDTLTLESRVALTTARPANPVSRERIERLMTALVPWEEPQEAETVV
jgi:hypothetical protein